jgi:hypothetical protein
MTKYKKMRNIQNDYDDEDYVSHNPKGHIETKRRQQKNWTKFYKDHESEYDDLDEFYN